jgi:phosphatidylserine synthase
MNPPPSESIAGDGRSAGVPPPQESAPEATGVIPPRPAIASYYRKPLTRLESRIWLPRVPPVAWSLIGVAVSTLAFAVTTNGARAAVVACALLADWLDGATARRHGGVGRTGYVRDVVADRVSEGLLFFAFADRLNPVGTVFLALWLVNIVLTAYSLKRNKHVVLPLRFAYLVIVLAFGF